MKRAIIRKVFIIMILVVFAFLLVGCNRLTEGEVYEKEFKPEETVLMFIPLIIYNGTGSSTIMMPYWVCYPDRYIIRIKAMVNDEWKTAEYFTDEDTYKTLDIGYMFCYDKERDLVEEPYTKTRAEGD